MFLSFSVVLPSKEKKATKNLPTYLNEQCAFGVCQRVPKKHSAQGAMQALPRNDLGDGPTAWEKANLFLFDPMLGHKTSRAYRLFEKMAWHPLLLCTRPRGLTPTNGWLYWFWLAWGIWVRVSYIRLVHSDPQPFSRMKWHRIRLLICSLYRTPLGRLSVLDMYTLGI